MNNTHQIGRLTNDSMLHFFNQDRKLPWLDMKVVDSEVTFNNRDDSYFIHSSIRCGKKMEIYSLIDSEVENVNLHHNKLPVKSAVEMILFSKE